MLKSGSQCKHPSEKGPGSYAIPLCKSAALHNQAIVSAVIQVVMKCKGLCGIIPAHLLAKAKVIEYDQAVLLGNGIPALGKPFEIFYFLMVSYVFQEVFIAGEVVQPEGVITVKETSVAHLETILLFQYHKVKPGIKWRRRSERA